MAPEVFYGSQDYPTPSPGPVLTIGNFDGVHLGHQYLLSRVVTRARERGAPACVFTFDPPPRAVLEPERCPPRISSLEQRLEHLGEVGIDQVVVERFDRAFASHSAAWFASEILASHLAPCALVVGHDFRFGRGRRGRTEDLVRLMPDLDVLEIDALTLDGRRPSSSRIREAVAEGRVADAAAMLGRPYAIRGTVVSGERRGRELGFPTANLETAAQLLPANGVYAVRVDAPGGRHDGVANLGIRPTFAGRRYLIEAHLLDFSGDLYDRTLTLSFVDFLRPERHFSGADALAAQIREDIARARAALAS